MRLDSEQEDVTIISMGGGWLIGRRYLKNENH